MAEAAKSEGLRLLRGGRFIHLMGDTDKSLAQRWLANQFRLSHQKDYRVVALGDSQNDVQMLADADFPVLVRSNRHDFPRVDTDADIYRTRRVGPSGWYEAIKSIVLREKG
ncbi:MAG: Glucosyl-3-phosphoglycerate/mannosyl-3-phosphoglycerate phosphatase [Gammaproteobacteria bacterium]|nr:MAG: Glucosyl-3-phosphoglycerate/mannosyl-3-phosphoglycerate phosphatase [Gammaproteobacteria bacterium]